MSALIVQPDLVATAAGNLTSIRSTLNEAVAAAQRSTTALVPAAQDEVSNAVALLFGDFGRQYQLLSLQARQFHDQFVSSLSSGAQAYLSAEAAAEQALSNAATPYEGLVANTVTNLQTIGGTFVGETAPAFLQTINSQVFNPAIPSAILQAATGDPLPLLALTGQFAQGYANQVQAITVQPSLVPLTTPGPNLPLALTLPPQDILAFDAFGPPVNALSATAQSGTAFVSAIQAGNPVAAATALIDAPANVTNAFLNGSETLAIGPGTLTVVGGLTGSATLNIPFSGLLDPLQPFNVTGQLVGNPTVQTVTITGAPVGGLVAGLLDTPSLLEGLADG
ncbi:PE family protein [Mycobacterium asiaticum]|uniref:PE domain-containing protein n=1 Tax=Mycobacterium asiaticum TaxID=1790 RepID=A0A1A3C4S5_MYCAS|nr:PE family protein [Mycobacterium asiaticum]OBI82095.1 hypothetical protein A9X01_22390 [Mycobacterium asiaticum]